MDYQVQYKGEKILLGLSINNAVLDIETDNKLLSSCLNLFDQKHKGSVGTTIGKFGHFNININIYHDNKVSIFIDGPNFDNSRVQSAAIWANKESLRDIIKAVLKNCQQLNSAEIMLRDRNML